MVEVRRDTGELTGVHTPSPLREFDSISSCSRTEGKHLTGIVFARAELLEDTNLYLIHNMGVFIFGSLRILFYPIHAILCYCLEQYDD